MIISAVRAVLHGLALPSDEPAIVTWRSIHLAPRLGADVLVIELSRTAFATRMQIVRLTPLAVIIATCLIAAVRMIVAARNAVRSVLRARRERREAWRAVRGIVRDIIRAK